jgi:hypothetical protein
MLIESRIELRELALSPGLLVFQNMAKVFTIGSRKAHDVTEFRHSCRSIGAALAKHGHTIVAAGCGDDDAETWVLDGANSAATPGKRISVIPFSPALPGVQDLIETIDARARWPNLTVESPFRTKGPWAVGQAVALIRSDVALMIGGGALTANVGSLALELQKPYYAVSGLGGAAKTIAEEDYAKHRSSGMPEKFLHPIPSDPTFGECVVMATQFVISKRDERVALRTNSLILIGSLAILGIFLAFLFRHDPFGNEPRLVYTAFLGAIVGVILSFLIRRVIDHAQVSWPALIGQTALACSLGVLYGIFALEAGSFYKVDIAKMASRDVDSIAVGIALLGVGVGAFLGPASRRLLEDLSHAAKVKQD